MATLHTLFKIGADISELQAGMSKAVVAIDSMERNTAKATSSLSNLGLKMASAFGGTMLIDRAVGVLGNFAREAFESAGVILDLSNKTGLATDTIQRMQFVAEQTGSTVEAFTRAAFMLGVNLEKGSGQIRGLGLSFEQLKAMRPDEQFLTVVKALEEMEDPQARNRVAVELFGKAAQEVLPSIAEGYTKIAESATVSSRAQLEALDKASDAWDAFVRNTQTGVTTFLGNVVLAAQGLGKAGVEAAAGLAKIALHGGNVGMVLAAVGAHEEEVAKATEKTARGFEDMSSTLFNLGGVVIPPTKSQLKSLSDETKRSADRFKEFENATRAAGVSIISGFGPGAEAMKDWLPEITTKLERAAQSQRDFEDAINATGVTIQTGLGPPADAMKDWLPEIQKSTQAAKVETVSWRDSLSELAQAMTQLSQTAGNSFVNALASMVNAINVGTKGIDSLREGFQNFTSGKGLSGILSGFSGIVGGIAGIVSAAQAAINIGKMLFSIFDRDKGRDLVEDFAKSFGGFDSLHRLLNQLGDEGERLWIMLTQGVGRNNPEQARAAIEAVRRAIDGLTQSAAGFPGITYHPGMEAPELGGEVPEFAGGSNGIRDFGRGTLAMLHGREAVITESQIRGMRGGGVTVVVNVNGSVTAERDLALTVSKHLDDYYRLNNKVRAA